MYFQALKYKRRNFLDLNDNNNQLIHPTYSKDSAWVKHVELSNLLCACITRMITNHAYIRKYRLRFFPNEFFACLCSDYPIKTKAHILYGCI